MDSDSAEPRIICRELECGYHGHAILRDIDLVLHKGESIALLGMNGAGKSTFIKTIAGDLKPLKGTVEIVSSEGTTYDRARLTPAAAARLAAIVPQEEINPFAFSVVEVVAMGRLAYSSSIFDSQEDLNAAREAMKTVECEHLEYRSITELSGGEKQRVLIARALAQQTPIVLMDEPTSHLDPPHQLSMSQLIASLAEKGKCVVTAVHDLNLASILANRALLISEGRVVADGDVEEVLESEELEECYKSKFERVRTKSGRLVVIPEMLALIDRF